MIDFLRKILRSPDGDGGGSGDAGSGDAGGSGDGAGGDGGAGGSGDAGGETWLKPFENVSVEQKAYDPITKTEKVVKISPKDDPNFNKYKTPEEFYKGHRNLVELVGKKGVIVPGEDAKPEEVEKFYNSIGRPEKPEGYKISPIENLHKSIEVTPESIGGYQMLAHKHGLSQKQADGLNRDYLTMMNKVAIENEARENQAVQKATDELKREWGGDFEANRNAIAGAILKTGGQEALDAMGGIDGLGNKPVVLRALGNLVKMLGEDQIKSFNIKNAGGNSGNGNETPEQAMQKIAEMNADSTHAFMDEKNPGHAKAVEERNRLYKIAYPGQEA